MKTYNILKLFLLSLLFNPCMSSENEENEKAKISIFIDAKPILFDVKSVGVKPVDDSIVHSMESPIAIHEDLSASTQIWKAFYKEILKHSQVVLDQQLTASFCSIPTYLDLINTNQNKKNGNIFYLGNTIPLDSLVYSPGSNLFTIYSLFLNCIKLNEDLNPQLQEEINRNSNELNEAQKELNNTETNAILRWKDYNKKHSGKKYLCFRSTMTFTRFLQKNPLNLRVL